MKKNTTYCYKGPDFVIENGIVKGAEETYIKHHNSFGEYVLNELKATPEFIGQIDGLTGNGDNFRKMMEKSVKCAMWLKDQNVQPGNIIGICTHNQMDMYVPCFASLYVGAIFNPWWNAGITKEMARHFLTLSCCKILFADEVSAHIILEVAKEIDMPLTIIVFGKLIGFQSLDDILASQDAKNVAEFRCTKLSSHADPAVMLYTSGSTGMPKGVLGTDKTLFGNVINFSETCNFEGTTVPLTFSSLAWSSGMTRLLAGVVLRETRIVYPEFSEEITFQLIEKYKVNWLLLGPSSSVRLQKSPAKSKYDLSSLKVFVVTGSVLKAEVQNEMAALFPNSKILQIYGSTELGGAVVGQNGDNCKSGSCGTILKNAQIKVVNTETGAILGPNQTGEACVKSEFMMIRYYKNPKATSETIDAEGWLHMADLVHYDKQGNFFVTDRIKDMIKYRGQHVSPAMIEQVLQAHPAVFEVGVVGIPNEIDDEHAVAFVAKKPNAQVTKEELMKLVTDKLPDYMKLRGGLHFLKELPHTCSGKTSKAELREMARTSKAS